MNKLQKRFVLCVLVMALLVAVHAAAAQDETMPTDDTIALTWTALTGLIGVCLRNVQRAAK